MEISSPLGNSFIDLSEWRFHAVHLPESLCFRSQLFLYLIFSLPQHCLLDYFRSNYSSLTTNHSSFRSPNHSFIPLSPIFSFSSFFISTFSLFFLIFIHSIHYLYLCFIDFLKGHPLYSKTFFLHFLSSTLYLNYSLSQVYFLHCFFKTNLLSIAPRYLISFLHLFFLLSSCFSFL